MGPIEKLNSVRRLQLMKATIVSCQLSPNFELGSIIPSPNFEEKGLIWNGLVRNILLRWVSTSTQFWFHEQPGSNFGYESVREAPFKLARRGFGHCPNHCHHLAVRNYDTVSCCSLWGGGGGREGGLNVSYITQHPPPSNTPLSTTTPPPTQHYYVHYKV